MKYISILQRKVHLQTLFWILEYFQSQCCQLHFLHLLQNCNSIDENVNHSVVPQQLKLNLQQAIININRFGNTDKSFLQSRSNRMYMYVIECSGFRIHVFLLLFHYVQMHIYVLHIPLHHLLAVNSTWTYKPNLWQASEAIMIYLKVSKTSNN